MKSGNLRMIPVGAVLFAVALVSLSSAFQGMALYTHGSLWGSGTIHLVTLNSSGETLSDEEIYSGKAYDPKFSPDGKKIAFIRDDKKVVIMNRDGSGRQEVGTASGDMTYAMGSWRHADKIYYSGDKNLKCYTISTGETATILTSTQSFRELDISENLRGTHGGMPPIWGFDLNAGTDEKVMDDCGGSINKSGTRVTNCWSSHRGFDIKSWGSFSKWKGVSTPTGEEALDPQFSGNSDDHICINEQGRSKPWLYKISSSKWVKVGSPSGNNHFSDFWSGTPPGVTPTVATPAITPESGSVTGTEVTVTITCETSGAAIRYTTNGADPTEQSSLYGGPVAVPVAGGGSVTVKARAYKSGMNPSGVASKVYTSVELREPENPAGVAQGLSYTYAEGSFSNVSDVLAAQPVSTGTADDFSLSVAERADNFGLVFDGYIEVPSDGVYTFHTKSDDGSVLWIGDRRVVDNDGKHAPQERSGEIGLKAGKHAITVAFLEAGGGEELTVSWAYTGQSKTAVPSSALYRAVNEAAALVLTNPKGGETFEVGEVLTVQWTTNVDLVASVVIEVSVDGGANWHLVTTSALTPEDDQWESYPWEIPLTLGSDGEQIDMLSSQCLIRVRDYKNVDQMDVCDASFTVQATAVRVHNDRAQAAGVIVQGDALVNRTGHAVRFDLYSLSGRTIRRGRVEAGSRYRLAAGSIGGQVSILRLSSGGAVTTRTIGTHATAVGSRDLTSLRIH